MWIILAYESICKEHGLEYLIVVVSPFSILTNMSMENQTAEDLCVRCRVGLNLESLVEELFDVRLTGDEEDIKGSEYIRSAFEDFDVGLELPEWYHFNKELLELNSPLSEEEEDHVKSILNKTLLKSLSGTHMSQILKLYISICPISLMPIVRSISAR